MHAPHGATPPEEEVAPAPEIKDLKPLVLRMAQEHRLMANALSVSLRCHLLPLMVSVNEAELRRLVRNLIQNALRHTPPGGRILMAIRAHGGQAWLWIVDTGSGMPDDLVRAHQRDAHAQAASEHLWQAQRPQDHSGWGLGLYIAHHIAEAQGWRLAFESRRGHGTTVRIRLGPVIVGTRGD